MCAFVSIFLLDAMVSTGRLKHAQSCDMHCSTRLVCICKSVCFCQSHCRKDIHVQQAEAIACEPSMSDSVTITCMLVMQEPESLGGESKAVCEHDHYAPNKAANPPMHASA